MKKWIPMLGLGFGFAVLGAALLAVPDTQTRIIGLLCLLFFGGGSAIVTVQLISGRTRLVLDRDGFSFATLFRQSRFEWREIDGAFGVVSISRSKLVMFSVNRAATRVTQMNQAICGYDYGLPDTYGMKPEKLAALMNEGQQRVLRQ
jgi:hypothetical protein